MMKAKMFIDGKTVVVIGLSHANLDQLRADGLNGHIEIKGEDLDIAGGLRIMITAASDEQEMLRAFEKGIREGTKLRIDPRLKS